MKELIVQTSEDDNSGSRALEYGKIKLDSLSSEALTGSSICVASSDCALDMVNLDGAEAKSGQH